MPRHLLVCTNLRGSGKPTCGTSGDGIIAGVQRELLRRRATEVLVTPTGCLGPCFDGPNVVVYPDGIWYAGITEADAAALADHLIDASIGIALAAKQRDRPGT